MNFFNLIFMKHPIYAILLAAIITFTFWSENPVKNVEKLKEKNKLVSIEKLENENSADSLSSKTKESKKNYDEIIEKNDLSLEETAIIKENKVNSDSTKKNISLPSDTQ